MSTLKVDGIRSNSATSNAISLADNGTCTANITNISNRRLTINGDMKIAQRGTSSTGNGYKTVDRFAVNFDSGLTEAPEQRQAGLGSGDTGPYEEGFRYALKITNGNQTSQDANDYIQIAHKIEAQNIAQSGWNYTSSSSYITLSFWVKASIAQTMYARLNAEDTPSSDARAFSFAFSATTSWTKITKTIPGNSTLVFNNDNGVGIALYIIPFYGTSYTTSDHVNDAWIVDSGSNQVTDMANTWFSGNDATLEVTGVQLEVSSFATSFEHKSVAEELLRCQRYYQISVSESKPAVLAGRGTGSSNVYTTVPLACSLRDTPSLSDSNFSQVYAYLYDSRPHNGSSGTVVTDSNQFNATGAYLSITVGGYGGNISDDRVVNIGGYASNNKLILNSEL